MKMYRPSSSSIVMGVCLLGERRSRGLGEGRFGGLVQDLATVRDERATRQLVVEVERELAVADEMREEARDGARVHLARVERHRAREIDRADDRDAVRDDVLAGDRERAVAALLGR